MGADGGQASLDPKSPGKLTDPNSAQQLGGSQKSPGSNPVPRISSPHRMSDSELAAQKQRLALAALPTTELGLMPSSLNIGKLSLIIFFSGTYFLKIGKTFIKFPR